MASATWNELKMLQYSYENLLLPDVQRSTAVQCGQYRYEVGCRW